MMDTSSVTFNNTIQPIYRVVFFLTQILFVQNECHPGIRSPVGTYCHVQLFVTTRGNTAISTLHTISPESNLSFIFMNKYQCH